MNKLTKKQFFVAGSVVLALICIVAGLYVGLTDVRLISREVRIVEQDGQKYEQILESYSDGVASAGMTPLNTPNADKEEDAETAEHLNPYADPYDTISQSEKLHKDYFNGPPLKGAE